MKNIVLILITALLFIGCGGSQPEVVKYPSWYLNPPRNSDSSLYGIGEGRDLATAKASALSSVSASLSVTVSSELKQSQSSQTRNGQESTYRSAISSLKAEVKEMEFSEYKIINNQQISSKFIILVEVSRQHLFNDQRNKLQRYSKELQDRQDNIKKSPLLTQVHLYEKSVQKTDKLKSLALLSKTINRSFDLSPYLEQIKKIKDSKLNALNKVRVSIHTTDEAEVFKDAIKEGLNRAGIKYVSSGANTDIYLKSSFLTDEVYGYKMAKANLSISTKSQNKTIASNTLKLSGKSRYDYQKAKLNAAQILRKKITTEGLFIILAIE